MSCVSHFSNATDSLSVLVDLLAFQTLSISVTFPHTCKFYNKYFTHILVSAQVVTGVKVVRRSLESWWHQPTFQRCKLRWSQVTRVSSTCVVLLLTPPTQISTQNNNEPSHSRRVANEYFLIESTKLQSISKYNS